MVVVVAAAAAVNLAEVPAQVEVPETVHFRPRCLVQVAVRSSGLWVL